MISKISLGTVQFGQDYGIANTRGKVLKSEIVEILNYAQSAGINTIDTAFVYGESEGIIGQYLEESSNSFKVISKLPPLEQYESGKVEECLEQSLQRLRVGQLYGYLLHQFSDIIKIDGLWDDLVRLKNDGKVEKIGFSLYSPDELVFLLDKEINFDIVQFPYSMFDQRFEKYLDILKKREVEVQARSVFLQGLAFLEPEELPASLQGARLQLEQLNQIAQEQKISIAALCLNFVYLNSHIDQILIGVDSLSQLKNNITGINLKNNVKNIFNQLKEIKIEQDDILLPFKWKTNYAQI